MSVTRRLWVRHGLNELIFNFFRLSTRSKIEREMRNRVPWVPLGSLCLVYSMREAEKNNEIYYFLKLNGNLTSLLYTYWYIILHTFFVNMKPRTNKFTHKGHVNVIYIYVPFYVLRLHYFCVTFIMIYYSVFF